MPMHSFESLRSCAGLFRDILLSATPDTSQQEFLCEVAWRLLRFSGCDALEIRLQLGESSQRWEARRGSDGCRHEKMPPGPGGERILWLADGSPRESAYAAVVRGDGDRSLPHFTKNGSFWTNDADSLLPSPSQAGVLEKPQDARRSRTPKSLAAILFAVDELDKGLLLLGNEGSQGLTAEAVGFFETVAGLVGISLANRNSQHALRERIKELTCLYGIAQLGADARTSIEELLGSVAALLPPAMQYPDHAHGRVVMDECSFATPGHPDDGPRLSSAVVLNGVARGRIEVTYSKTASLPDESVFLREETSLLRTVAHQLALLIEQREAVMEQGHLQEQLRHADRLATIGELAAGAAHELNEPLASILGFAQLAGKVGDLPDQVSLDLQKIVTASLYAREVVKKLLIFSRQMPVRKTTVNLNEIVREGLSFLGARCAKEGVQMDQVLDPALPRILADPAQLQQVLVNLVVNAVQAMPQGGHLTIRTVVREGGVVLAVEDTGVGMDEEVANRIFLPFFTTKKPGHGTGLGLAVVHGIVSSHGGRISVVSAPDHGSRFEVFLPVGDASTQRNGGTDAHGH